MLRKLAGIIAIVFIICLFILLTALGMRFFNWALGDAIPTGMTSQIILAIDSFIGVCIILFFFALALSCIMIRFRYTKSSWLERPYKKFHRRYDDLSIDNLMQEPETRKNLEALKKGEL